MTPLPGRAVEVRCTVCGLRVAGRRREDNTVHASDRSRPPEGSVPLPGLCWLHWPTRPRPH